MCQVVLEKVHSVLVVPATDTAAILSIGGSQSHSDLQASGLIVLPKGVGPQVVAACRALPFVSRFFVFFILIVSYCMNRVIILLFLLKESIYNVGKLTFLLLSLQIDDNFTHLRFLP